MKFICNNPRCKQQRVRARVGEKHHCGGTFVQLVEVGARVPRAHQTERAVQGKGVLRPKKGA